MQRHIVKQLIISPENSFILFISVVKGMRHCSKNIKNVFLFA